MFRVRNLTQDLVASVCLLLFVFLSFIGFVSPASAQVSVAVKSGRDLRDIAQTYLGDADLWPVILEENGFTDFSDITTGAILTLPTDAVSAARSAIEDALKKIQSANEIGAQIFAFTEINAAIAQHDDALLAKKQGAWGEALAYAVEAGDLARNAYELSEKSRDKAAEARLSDRQGWVEGQRAEELGWGDRDLNAVLVEEEKIRTLSRSSAQITFRDAGRLRLNANSHAVIQQMRVDPLRNREDAKVSLVEGDFYALLGGNSGRKGLKVDVPDVNALIDSGDFWVRQDVSGAKFTNYDDDKVQIAAYGDSVTLGRNEGVVIRSGTSPAGKIDLLEAPELQMPGNERLVFNSVAQLSWLPVDGAAGYWVEVARDPNFNQMVETASALTDPSFVVQELDIGDYFWRVAALDQFGLPGTRSLARRFLMRVDRSPPFLQLEGPSPDQIYRDAAIDVEGESEPGARVTVNGTEASIAQSGRFTLQVALQPGVNPISVVAVDPAGNETSRSLEVAHKPDAVALVTFNQAMPRLSARHFLAAGIELSVSGATEADAYLEVIDAAGALRAEAATDATGQFAFLLPLASGEEKFTLKVVSASGFASEEVFQVSQDMSAPEIVLDSPLPRLTSVEWLALRGAVKNADRVLLNGRDIPLEDDRFDEVVTLEEGRNTIEMSARDAAGNVVVDSWQVLLDQAPPSLVDYNVADAGAGRVKIEVVAEDQNGLAKAAPFTLTTGGEEVSGFLKFNKLSRSYRSTVSVPSAGGVALKTVELLDDAGNRTKVRIR